MSLGSGEILIIVVLALLLFGPDKLPELARQTARVIRDIRRAADDVKSQFNLLGDDDEEEPRRPLSSMRDKINDDHEFRDDNSELSSTRSSVQSQKIGDEIDEADSYSINDKNGNAPDDNNWNADPNDARNDWRSREEDIEYSSRKNDEPMSDEPMTTQEKTLFDTAPIKGIEATEKPRDALSELELRVTPTTSVARTSAPNRVREDDL